MEIKRYSVLFTLCLLALTSCHKQGGQDVPSGKEEYAVGDYYDVFGVKGIVFQVDEDKKHGTIVSLAEFTEKQWALGGGLTNAYYPEYGGYNWMVITAIPSWTTTFPAFAAVNQLNAGSVVGWYLPSIDELNRIYKNLCAGGNMEKTNALISAHGGDPIRKAFYWSSTEYGAGVAYHMDYSNGAYTDEPGYDSFKTGKTNAYSVRGAKRF